MDKYQLLHDLYYSLLRALIGNEKAQREEAIKLFKEFENMTEEDCPTRSRNMLIDNMKDIIEDNSGNKEFQIVLLYTENTDDDIHVRAVASDQFFADAILGSMRQVMDCGVLSAEEVQAHLFGNQPTNGLCK